MAQFYMMQLECSLYDQHPGILQGSTFRALRDFYFGFQFAAWWSQMDTLIPSYMESGYGQILIDMEIDTLLYQLGHSCSNGGSWNQDPFK